MSLAPGKILAHYRLLEKIAQGGMGEVYAAEDTRLKRRVALKTLPPEMAADTERLDRFQREAEVVASLNHPNIVTIHSVEEAGGVRFLTMEMVEGQTLDRVVPETGLSLEKFFDIAIPLADAVSAAHERGITHRDLKPGNVMVGPEGRVKVLDFGLAKLQQEIAATEETSLLTEQVTQDGRVLGTVPYMSPEQVQGKPVDSLSDIFSLGIILYEMATGQRPFKGDSSAHVISSILRDTPNTVTDLNDRLPRHLARIIRRCLQKDPKRRFQTALDLRNELEELRGEVQAGEVQPVSVSMAPVSLNGRRTWWPLVVFVVALAAVVSVWLIARRPAGESAGVPLETTFTQLTNRAGQELQPSLSPDGKFVAFASEATGNWDIYLQRVGGRNPINLTEGAPEDDGAPVFSPDGERIAFRSERDGGGLFVMGATGESVRRVTNAGFDPAWSPDGTRLVYADEGTAQNPYGRNLVSKLWVVDVGGGEPRVLYEGDAVQPNWSPNGHRIAFWGLPDDSGQRDLWTIPADGGDPASVTRDAPLDWNPVWSPDGEWLYFSSDRGGSLNLWRIPIDEESGEVRGDPEPVTTPSRWSGQLSFSRDGRMLAFTALDNRVNVEKATLDPGTGVSTSGPQPVTSGTAAVFDADLSPDGRWLVYRSTGRQEDLFVVSSDGAEVRQLTDDPHKDRGPDWSPDGNRILFYSDRSGRYELWIIKPDGSGLEQVTKTTGRSMWYPFWSPDGTQVAAHNEVGTFTWDLSGGLPVGEGTPLPPVGEDLLFSGWEWSPDGTRIVGDPTTLDGFNRAGTIVYSFETGKYESVSDFGQSFDGGWGGLGNWMPDSRNVVIAHDHDLYRVDTATGESSKVLSSGDASTLIPVGVSADGSTIFFARFSSESDIWLLTLN
jgi:Tol biopolymer transport system component/serine/threonine protein kinase